MGEGQSRSSTLGEEKGERQSRSSTLGEEKGERQSRSSALGEEKGVTIGGGDGWVEVLEGEGMGNEVFLFSFLNHGYLL